MKPIVIIGTSHSTVRYAPSLTECLKEVSSVKNLAAYGHGIDTYFPRVINQKEPSIFVIEAPHHTRYTEFMNQAKYEKFSYSTDEFWTEKHYMEYLAFYSKTVLLKEDEYRSSIRSSRNDLAALQRIKVLANEQLELEDNIIKCNILDGYLKHNGHSAYWWTANNKMLYNCQYDFNYLLDKPLFDYFPDKKMYSDGYHLDDKYFQPIVTSRFVKEIEK